MDPDVRHARFEAARLRGELTVQELWLRYVAIGGTSDAFEVEGWLVGLVPMETFQQDVLAQALNERLEELYRGARIPLTTELPDDDIPLQQAVAALLHHRDLPGATKPPAAPEADGSRTADQDG